MKSAKLYKAVIIILSVLIVLSASFTVSLFVFKDLPEKIISFFQSTEPTEINSQEQTSEAMTFSYSRLTVYQPTSQNIRPIGRTLFHDNTLWFSMSGCGAEFNCKGKYAEINFTVYNSRYITYSHRPRIAVYVNNFPYLDEVLEEEEQSFKIDLDAFGNNAVIKIVKLSESMYSCVGIKDIRVFSDTVITPTSGNKIKIEYIGDSITCGYGLDEESSRASFMTRTENFSKTYAYLAANALDGECYAVGFSGYGVVSGFTSNGSLQDEYVLSRKYGKSVTGMNFENEYLTDWSFQKYKPDLIIINLGTNDASYCSTYERRQRFIEEYINLLSLVRKSNPDPFIVCILGDMNNSLYPSIEEAVASYAFNSGDNKVRCTTVSFDMGLYGSTIDGHPNIDSNILASETLEKYLKENIFNN